MSAESIYYDERKGEEAEYKGELTQQTDAKMELRPAADASSGSNESMIESTCYTQQEHQLSRLLLQLHSQTNLPPEAIKTALTMIRRILERLPDESISDSVIDLPAMHSLHSMIKHEGGDIRLTALKCIREMIRVLATEKRIRSLVDDDDSGGFITHLLDTIQTSSQGEERLRMESFAILTQLANRRSEYRQLILKMNVIECISPFLSTSSVDVRLLRGATQLMKVLTQDPTFVAESTLINTLCSLLPPTQPALASDQHDSGVLLNICGILSNLTDNNTHAVATLVACEGLPRMLHLVQYYKYEGAALQSIANVLSTDVSTDKILSSTHVSDAIKRLVVVRTNLQVSCHFLMRLLTCNEHTLGTIQARVTYFRSLDVFKHILTFLRRRPISAQHSALELCGSILDCFSEPISGLTFVELLGWINEIETGIKLETTGALKSVPIPRSLPMSLLKILSRHQHDATMVTKVVKCLGVVYEMIGTTVTDKSDAVSVALHAIPLLLPILSMRRTLYAKTNAPDACLLTLSHMVCISAEVRDLTLKSDNLLLTILLPMCDPSRTNLRIFNYDGVQLLSILCTTSPLPDRSSIDHIAPVLRQLLTNWSVLGHARGRFHKMVESAIECLLDETDEYTHFFLGDPAFLKALTGYQHQPVTNFVRNILKNAPNEEVRAQRVRICVEHHQIVAMLMKTLLSEPTPASSDALFLLSPHLTDNEFMDHIVLSLESRNHCPLTQLYKCCLTECWWWGTPYPPRRYEREWVRSLMHITHRILELTPNVKPVDWSLSHFKTLQGASQVIQFVNHKDADIAHQANTILKRHYSLEYIEKTQAGFAWCTQQLMAELDPFLIPDLAGECIAYLLQPITTPSSTLDQARARWIKLRG